MSGKSVDMSGKLACQLMPSPDFLSEADFIDSAGKHREYSLTIAAVTSEELQLPGRSDETSKIVVAFVGAKKRLVLNKTNMRAIKSQHGVRVADWLGKKISVIWTLSEPKSGKQIRNPSGGPPGGVRVRGE